MSNETHYNLYPNDCNQCDSEFRHDNLLLSRRISSYGKANRYPQEESADGTSTQTVTPETSDKKESLQNNVQNSTTALSADGQVIERTAEEFAAAYFGGAIDTIQNYLTVPYEWDIDVYTGTGVISEVNLKRVIDIGEEELGNIEIIFLEYRDSNIEETLLYLTLEFIKKEDGWKIRVYGVEG